MITLHPVSYIGAPMLLAGLYVATLAAFLACPLLSLGAGGVALMAGSVLAMGES